MPVELPGQEFFQQRINQAIAELLASDPANANYLTSLNNTSVAVESINPTLSLLLVFTDNQLQIQSPGQDNPVQLRIKGNALNLVKLLGTPVDNATKLRQLGIEITGDIGLLLEMSQLANKIEIDWEYLLSERLGEAPAVLLSRASHIARTQVSKTGKDLQDYVKIYLSERSNLPTQTELQEVRREIRDLGYRLDRLELATKQENH